MTAEAECKSALAGTGVLFAQDRARAASVTKVNFDWRQR